jgi:antitoxin MazE
MQVSKWGNSLAVRLPKKLVDELGLKEGDELNVVAASGKTVEVESAEQARQRALARMARRGWAVPEGWRFDRDEANER